MELFNTISSKHLSETLVYDESNEKNPIEFRLKIKRKLRHQHVGNLRRDRVQPHPSALPPYRYPPNKSGGHRGEPRRVHPKNLALSKVFCIESRSGTEYQLAVKQKNEVIRLYSPWVIPELAIIDLLVYLCNNLVLILTIARSSTLRCL